MFLFIFLSVVMLAGCADREQEAHEAIDLYLKNYGIIVEELKITSIKPITRGQYLKTVMKEITHRTEPFNMMKYTVNGRIPDSLNRFVDSMLDIKAQDDRPVRDFVSWYLVKENVTISLIR